LAIPTSGQETLRRDHSRFYRSGSTLDINEVVGLEKVEGGRVVTVTIGFNMTRSKLEVDWVCNGEVLQHSKLDQGMDKEITYTFNRPLPASFEARFAGPDGQVQVRWVKAVTAPLEAGEAMIVKGLPPERGDITAIKPVDPLVAELPTPIPLQIDEDSLLTPAELAPFVRRVEIEPLVIRPGTTATGRVVLGAKALVGGFVVPLEVNGPKASAIHVPHEVVVEAGRSEIEFAIKADPAGDDEASVGRSGCLFNIVAKGGLRGTGSPQRSAQVLQPELDSLQLEPRDEVRAGDTAYVTLVLAEPASPGGTVVSLRAEGPPEEVAQVPKRLWVDEGEIGASFPIAIGARSSGYLSVEGRSAIMTLDDQVDIRFGVPISAARLEPSSLRPGTNADLVVELAEPAMVGGATISLDVTGEGAEWVNAAPEVWIEEGETTGIFEVAIAPLSGGQLTAARMADWNARRVVFEVATPVLQKGYPQESRRILHVLITQVEIEDLRFAENMVPAGQAAVATITLEEPAGPGGTFVWLSLSGFAADYASVPDEIQFAEGEMGREVEVPIDLTASARIHRDFTFGLEARSNDRTKRSTVQVVYPTWIKSVVANPSVIPIGESFTFTVTMTEPIPWDDFWVGTRGAEEGWHPIQSSGSSTLNCVVGDGPVAIPKGETTVAVAMKIADYCKYEGPIKIWAVAQRLDYLSVAASAEIVIWPKIESLDVTNEQTVSPGSTVRYYLRLTEGAPVGGIRIRLSTVEPSIQASWPEQITVARGVRDTTFDVTLAPGETGSFAIRAEIFAGDIRWSTATKRITIQSE
jgi:hypothetical protein